MLTHSMWLHMLHMSKDIERSLSLTSLLHILHGYLGFMESEKWTKV